jgi:hypothetical protein
MTDKPHITLVTPEKERIGRDAVEVFLKAKIYSDPDMPDFTVMLHAAAELYDGSWTLYYTDGVDDNMRYSVHYTPGMVGVEVKAFKNIDEDLAPMAEPAIHHSGYNIKLHNTTGTQVGNGNVQTNQF